jgi:integrase
LIVFARFALAYADRPVRTIGAADVSAWLKGGRNRGTVDALRAMFNDARKPQAGMLIDANPFAALGLKKSSGRKDLQPPDAAAIARMIALADELTPPSFAAYLFTACWSAARPGELDALKWSDVDEDAETIRIERQWNAKLGKITPPKHGSRRTIALTDRVRDRLATLPRESEWVFTTLRGSHYTPSARNFHRNRVRCATGLGMTSMYLATRHFYGWYALNVLGLPPHVIALQLGHTDGGRLSPSCTATRTRRSLERAPVTPSTCPRPCLSFGRRRWRAAIQDFGRFGSGGDGRASRVGVIRLAVPHRASRALKVGRPPG